ncbi:MAG TPA: PhoH family protein [Bacteroidia bacterium]|nr:PhoH family protein [Bacteroidia bacterium]
MAERVIEIQADPVEVYGVNDSKLDQIRKYFPTLKLIARGHSIRAIGEEKELRRFEKSIAEFLKHYSRYGTLTETIIDRIVNKSPDTVIAGEEANNALVYGNSGLIVRARTANQLRMVESCDKNDMIFAIGPAGTGKTYTAVALAVRALKNKEVKKIILTRPAVEAGENLGFLPGDLKDKLDPYLQPLYDALYDMLPAEKLHQHIENRVVEIAPLAFMRGRTLDSAFVILDEAQNATEAQLKMFLTRMGPSAKFVITGDLTQIDLPRNQPSGLQPALDRVKNIPGIEIIYLDTQDVIRHKLVKQIIEAYTNDQTHTT